MKVTMETVKSLRKTMRTGSVYIPISYEGHEYAQIADMDTLSSDGDGQGYWEALAVRLGDSIDDDGYAPLYDLIWLLDNQEAELAEDTVEDWEAVSEIREAGEINIENGRIY